MESIFSRASSFVDILEFDFRLVALAPCSSFKASTLFLDITLHPYFKESNRVASSSCEEIITSPSLDMNDLVNLDNMIQFFYFQ